MSRVNDEKTYWDLATLDKNLERKYISDVGKEAFDRVAGLEGEVLEIGCGIGRLLEDNYTGIDISPRMVARAWEAGKNAVFCDGRSIPFANNMFDYVFSALVFQHIPFEGKEAYTKEAYRVLRPGGTIIVQYVNEADSGPFSLPAPDGLMKMMFETTGFTDIKTEEAVLKQWTWITARKPK